MVPGLNITVVEDHDFLRGVIVDLLTKQGHNVHGLFCAEDVDDDPRFALTDVYVIDLNLPDEDGLSLARRIRASHPKVGIVMVTARDKLDDKIRGYESGADVYLAKPVDPQELVAVIGAFSRRIQEDADQTAALRVDRRALTLNGPAGCVALSQSEIILLSGLTMAPGRMLERWQLMDAIGKDGEGISNTSLEVRIATLRKKIATVSETKPAIQSIRNVGYKLCVPVIVH